MINNEINRVIETKIEKKEHQVRVGIKKPMKKKRFQKNQKKKKKPPHSY
jgi:hypothetical protein